MSDLEVDPFPIYKRLRDTQPVAFVPAVNLWLVTRWEDVGQIIHHPELLSPDTNPSTLNRTIGKSLMRTEGAYHRQVRALLEPPLRASHVRSFADKTVSTMAHDLIDKFAGSECIDLVSQFAEPLSVRTLQKLLGLDEVPESKLRSWFDRFATGGANFEGDLAKQEYADAGSREADETLEDILDTLEESPNDSMLSALLSAQVDGRKLSRAEILANLKLMILGGMQEPRDLIGITCYALLSDPSNFEKVQEDASVLKVAIEEAMRWCAPVGTLTRQATEEVEIGGVTLDPGAMVAAVIASANRDERHWKDPDLFLLDRTQGTHLAFGAGTHFCIGAALARHEVRVALSVMFERLPDMRFADEKVVFRGWEFRGPVTLPVSTSPN